MSDRPGLAGVRLLAAALLFVSGCGGADPTEPATLSFTLTPASATVDQGGSVNVTGTATASGSFSGGVTVTVEDWPLGVTPSVHSIVPAGANTSVTITLSVSVGMAAGTYPITIRASGSGVDTDVTFTLTVNAVSEFSLAVSPDTLTIEQGTGGTRDVTLARVNFTGPVNLAAEGAPAGLTVAFAPNPVTTSASVATVTAAGSVAVGSYDVVIRGTASVPDAVDTLTVTVVAATGPAYTIDVTPDTLTINQGDSDVATVDVTRINGHTDNVTLALIDGPASINGSFVPNPATGATSDLTVSVGTGVATGGYDMNVRGQDGALADRLAPLHVIVTPAPAYTMEIDPDTLTIEQGTSGSTAITLARTNFTGDVTFSLEGAPTNVNGAFSVNPTPGDTATLTVSVGGSVALGEYSLTLRGTAGGLTDRTQTIILNVEAQVGFTISSLPDQNIQAGESDSLDVIITRTGGFTGSVSFAVTSSTSPELTGSFNPVSTTGDTVKLTVSSTTALPAPQTHFLGITASAAGEPDVLRSVDVNVSPPPASGNITLDFASCDFADRPIWLAFQDGAGPWTRVNNISNQYQFDVQQSMAGVAWTTSSSGNTAVIVYYLTQAELLAGGTVDACDVPATKSVSFSVSNFVAGHSAEIGLGGAYRSFFTNGAQTPINNVPLGVYDVIGLDQILATPGSERVFVRRDQDVTDLGTIDMNGGEWSAVVPGTMTVAGLVAGEVALRGALAYMTNTSADACLSNNLLAAPTMVGSSFTAFGVPPGVQRATDFHDASFTAVDGLAGTVRTTSERFNVMADRTITMGALLPTPTINTLSGPFKRLEASLTMPAEYNSWSSLTYGTGGAGSKSVFVWGSADYLGAGAQTLTMPDLSGVTNWDNSWVPATTDTGDLVVSGFGSTGAYCSEGGRSVSSLISGTF